MAVYTLEGTSIQGTQTLLETFFEFPGWFIIEIRPDPYPLISTYGQAYFYLETSGPSRFAIYERDRVSGSGLIKEVNPTLLTLSNFVALAVTWRYAGIPWRLTYTGP